MVGYWSENVITQAESDMSDSIIENGDGSQWNTGKATICMHYTVLSTCREVPWSTLPQAQVVSALRQNTESIWETVSVIYCCNRPLRNGLK